MRSWSLRRRLVLGLGALVGVGLVAVGFIVVLILKGYLYNQLDKQLDRPVGPPGAVCGTADRQAVAPPINPGGGSPVRLPTNFVFTVLKSDGSVALQSDSTSKPDLSEFTTSYVESLGGALVTVPSLDGGSGYRVRATTCTLDGAPASQVIAVSLSSVDSTIRSLAVVIAIVGAIVLLLLILLAQVVVRLGLRPLDAVEDTAEAIAAGDLSRRVPDGAPGTEVGRLSASLNGMLGQIEVAFAEREASEGRLRRFVGDASHELRTPLTSIRGYAELFRQGALEEPADQRRALNAIESEAARMGALVDELLLLARLDQQRPLEQEQLELTDIVREAVDAARVRDQARTIEVELPKAAVRVVGDAARLRQVLDNLLGNALVHTPSESEVRVVLSSAAGGCRIVVSDRGPGMTPEQVSHVFERFYRADPARTREHGGSGLGMSLVQAVISSHGGSVTCVSTVAEGTTVTVELPAG